MRTLIIPVLHYHILAAEEWVASYSADQIVFLGDYFDNVGDTPEIAATTASWLRDSLRDPKRVHLWGNHDLPYAIPQNDEFLCPGFSEEKCRAISGILRWDDHWHQLKFVHFVGDYALSHAGISSAIFEDRSMMGILGQCERALHAARLNEKPLDPVLSFSGIVWQRWWVMEHIAEFHQIVGHSTLDEAGVEWKEGRLNVCLDTYGRYLGWIEAGKFSLIDTETQQMTLLSQYTPIRTE